VFVFKPSHTGLSWDRRQSLLHIGQHWQTQVQAPFPLLYCCVTLNTCLASLGLFIQHNANLMGSQVSGTGRYSANDTCQWLSTLRLSKIEYFTVLPEHCSSRGFQYTWLIISGNPALTEMITKTILVDMSQVWLILILCSVKTPRPVHSDEIQSSVAQEAMCFWAQVGSESQTSDSNPGFTLKNSELRCYSRARVFHL
jgi:hypothetical protein